MVLPDVSEDFDTPLAIHVLARAASDEGVDLSIVSTRRQVHYWAAAEGLACYRSTADLPRRNYGVRTGELNLLGEAFADAFHLIVRGSSWVFAGCIVLVVAGLVVLLVPRAIVTVRPVTDDLSSSVQIDVSMNATDPDPVKGVLPGRQVYMLLDATGQIPISRPDHHADGHAVGWITIENRTPSSIVIPRGTDVSTYSSLHFATTDARTLPARAGASVTVPIRALAPGPGSNVPRGEILVVNGPLHWLVAGVNEEPTAGGGSFGTSIVTPWDNDKIVQQVTASAHQDADRQIAGQLGPNERSIPATTQVSPIDETFTHRAGDIAPDLGLDAHFRASAVIYNVDQFRTLAVQLWHPQIRPGFNLREDSVDVGDGTIVDVTVDRVRFKVPIHAVAYKSVNIDRIVAFARLRTPATIEKELGHDYDLESSPTVTISPPWLSRAFRVSVVVDTSAPPSAVPGATSASPAAT
jgi:hypothetical protein